MSASSIALEGLDQANDRLNEVAAAIATDGTGANSPGPDMADLGADMVSLTSAQTQFEADVAVLQTGDQMEQGLINVTA